ncbi:hypothetical protein VNO78_03189 [Psophocarpus tetragonolobus]|uniref:Uncharacterized protein n=1 Tax=Psophocarpus tetragonolobus TaxID=3891 RepID=A0AAN9XVQ8_PSOTE
MINKVKVRSLANTNVVNHLGSKGFHVLPKGRVPPSAPSRGCSDPPCDHALQGLNPPTSLNDVKAPVHRYVVNINNIKAKKFHVLPKGPVPPSAPSHGCSDPPC